MNIPALNPGERYAGIIINEDGTLSHHLILLPKQPDTRLTWDEAVAWAQDDLPTRQEQALLYANCKDAFKLDDWHWSSTQFAGHASLAWYQYFGDGAQLYDDKGHKGRVRAVRRVLID